jgi:hypothetical protein
VKRRRTYFSLPRSYHLGICDYQSFVMAAAFGRSGGAASENVIRHHPHMIAGYFAGLPYGLKGVAGAYFGSDAPLGSSGHHLGRPGYRHFFLGYSGELSPEAGPLPELKGFRSVPNPQLQ